MKTGLLRSDWLAGLAISVLIIVMGNWGAFDSLERSAYDYGVRATIKAPNEKIAVIAIDDESIANIGRWPWPRNIHADMHRILQQGGAKIIGQTTFFTEHQLDPGLKHIHDMIEFYGSTRLADMATLPRFRGDYLNLPSDMAALEQKLIQAEEELNTDKILTQSLKDTNNVILAMHFDIGIPRGRPIPACQIMFRAMPYKTSSHILQLTRQATRLCLPATYSFRLNKLARLQTVLAP